VQYQVQAEQSRARYSQQWKRIRKKNKNDCTHSHHKRTAVFDTDDRTLGASGNKILKRSFISLGKTILAMYGRNYNTTNN
jgi:hypothetical protein